MTSKPLQSLYVVTVLLAMGVSAACSSSGSSSAVAPVPVRSLAPSPTASPTPTRSPKPTPSPTPTITPTPTPTPTATVTPTPSPTPTCSGTSTLTQPLVDAGGTLVVPQICTFTGTVTYASNNAPSGMTITFTTSVQNVFGVPSPNGGTPIMYTRTKLGTTQGTNVKFDDCSSCNATITSPTLSPSQTYALCAYIGTFPVQQAPEVVGSPVNGTVTYPSPLTAEGLKALNGFLPTDVNIDTVVTAGVPTSCAPARERVRR